MNKQKRTAAIHDISCVGKCSETVALPVLSAAGIETSLLPTALLSTHTGGFTGYTFLDLTDEMKKIAAHWKSLGIEFDAIYTGYLGSFEQLDIVNGFIDDFKTKETLVLVDPVMADTGVFYRGFTDKFAKGMFSLCSKADVIVPNITEALFMLGEEYKEGPYDEKFIKELLRKLTSGKCRKAVLTGVYYDEKELGAASYDADSGEFALSLSTKVEGYYHGTGDVFASALLAALLRGKDLAKATDIAVKFTHSSIVRTFEADTDKKYGVNFEEGFPELLELLR